MQFISFLPYVVSHCIDIPPSIYLCTCWWDICIVSQFWAAHNKAENNILYVYTSSWGTYMLSFSGENTYEVGKTG